MIHKDILMIALRDGKFVFGSDYGNFILIPERDWEYKLKDSQSTGSGNVGGNE